MKDSTFWLGWTDALEALDTRLSVTQKEITSRTNPHDLLLDIRSEITSLLNLTSIS